MKDGVFARNVKQPVLKLERLQAIHNVPDPDLYNQMAVKSPEKMIFREAIPKRHSVIDTSKSPSRMEREPLRALDQLKKNQTINVFGNNNDKTLAQRIRDLNVLHHDLSPSNMVAYAQLPE